MNQVFKITVGPETIEGRLPPRRVGQHYNCRFHISGVAPDAVTAPKIWISVSGGSSVFWTAEFDYSIGLWTVDVNTDATETVGSFLYALTIYDDEAEKEFIVGQGAFTVYANIAAGSETGGTAGESLWSQVVALGERVTILENRFLEFAGLDMFDPLTAKDSEMRAQVQEITNILRGV